MAAARCGGQPGPDADHVRHRRRTAADRIRGHLARGLRGCRTGADRQRRRRPAAARRLRRGAGRAVSGAAHGAAANEAAWALERALLEHLETIWEQPDEGIWEVRGGRRHFTHSKVMAWVAFDRAVRSVEEFGLERPGRALATRCATRSTPRCAAKGFDAELNTFVQSYGSKELDASLLLLPLVGFLPADDPRMHGTVAAIEQHLLKDGFVLRYDTAERRGRPAGDEGAFLACSFWLADNYILQGRDEDARTLFERLLALRNDVGLLAEEYDPKARRLVGNFPQAFSHVALINTAHNLTRAFGPAQHRAVSKESTDND